MTENYQISFIEQKDFELRVEKTISKYNDIFKSIDLEKFNSNIIDPIKLTFDKYLLGKEIEEVIAFEIQRQQDKSISNEIGYFHQNMFKHIKNCEVPLHGFDVIFTRPDGKKIYVEMKNKHNTMNASSSQKTYINMQNQIINNPNDMCFLVEVIAPVARNIAWKCSVNGQTVSNEKIRRVSIDKFYEIVTSIPNAFYQICKQLPITIEKLIKNNKIESAEGDTVIDELRSKSPDLLKGLYMLAFKTYNGFHLNI